MVEGIRNLIAFAILLGSLIFFHELGHFLAAIKLGVKIKEFGLGFPPKIMTIGTWKNTKFTLNLIPIGGFVRPEGEDDPTIEGGLASSKPIHRLAILSAGSGVNLLLSIIILTIGFASGWPDKVSIVNVSPESPASYIGLQSGDLIVKVNEKEIHIPQELAEITYSNLGRPIDLEIDRNGTIFNTTVTPRNEWPNNQGPIGVSLSWEIVNYPLPKATLRALQECANQIKSIISLPVGLITSQIQTNEVRLISPIGLKTINDHAVEAAMEMGKLFPILQIIAFVSLALSVTNLMPLPALDGGRILFVIIEIIRGKRIDPQKEGLVHFMGMTLLIGLMAILVMQDLTNPIIIE